MVSLMGIVQTLVFHMTCRMIQCIDNAYHSDLGEVPVTVRSGSVGILCTDLLCLALSPCGGLQGYRKAFSMEATIGELCDEPEREHRVEEIV